MMKILSKIFKKYEEDDISPYIHSGVGYMGITHELWHGEPARIKHRGIGWTGVYYE